jgi:hypothetical protein
LVLSATLVALLLSYHVESFIGSAGTPAAKVPATRWGTGNLEPGPLLIDATHIDGEPWDTPFALEVATAGDYLFMATGQGILIWDVTDPQSPSRFPYVDGSNMQMSGIFWSFSDTNFLWNHIATVPGNDDLVVVGGTKVGLVVLNAATKNSVSFAYQDGSGDGHYVQQVYAARLQGREYAFAISHDGLLFYDLTTASGLTHCSENAKVNPGGCGNVYQGSMVRAGGVKSVAGVGEFVVLRSDNKRVEVFHVINASNFLSTAPRLDVQLSMALAGAVLWEHDYVDNDGIKELYLGLLTKALSSTDSRIVNTYLQVYDVDCVRTGNCSLGDPLASYDVTDGLTNTSVQSRLTASTDNGTPYLSIGNENTGQPHFNHTCVKQREFVLDMSLFDRSSPPPLATLDLTPVVAEGYWSWYYEECHNVLPGGGWDPDPPGFNEVRPHGGVVHGGYYYRAAYRIGDSHKITTHPEPPEAPEPPEPDDGNSDYVYREVGKLFLNMSSDSPQYNSWRWSFEGGSPSTSFLKHPTVTFSTTGTKTIILQAFTFDGRSETFSKTVNVVEGAPGSN